MRIALLTPRRRFIANRYGIGYQVPLGLVFLGGPLLDQGHDVRLIDNDVLGWDDRRLVDELSSFRPEAILIGHTGSTAAHPVAMATARALKRFLPGAKIIYGGIYPSYAAAAIIRENPDVDIIVRGEGEGTVLELVACLGATRASEGQLTLQHVKGITWRAGSSVMENVDRPPIQDLDRFRPGWELLDWSAYSLFGFGRSAGMQFSRGCPLRCSYCGQWGFWKRWRHRSAANFVGELEILVRKYGVKIIWLADENFGADREKVAEVLERLIEKDLGLSLNVNMTAADVVRDADLLPQYKRAGVDNIVMGIESLENSVIAKIPKNNPYCVSKEAVRLLRQHGIVSLVNVIFGLGEESLSAVVLTFRRLLDLDPDILNAVYFTPHFWTAAGRTVKPGQIIQADQALWTYRNQVVHANRLSPGRLFASVKLTEALFHLRPRALLRLVIGLDQRSRRILRGYLVAGAKVFFAEVLEFCLQTRFLRPGILNRAPGCPALKADNPDENEPLVQLGDRLRLE